MLGTKKTWSSLVNWFQINSCWIHCSTLTSSSAGSGKHVPIWHLKVMQEFNFCLCLMLKGILYPEHLNDIMALTYVSEGLEHTVAYFLRQTTICTDFALNCSHNIRWSLPWCDGTGLCPLSQTFGRFPHMSLNSSAASREAEGSSLCKPLIDSRADESWVLA